MTGFGLAVAIPGVIGYNALTRANRVLAARLDAFAYELHTFVSIGQPLGAAPAPSRLLPTFARWPAARSRSDSGAAMAFASFDSRRAGTPMSDINMVPLIDVMLVLLVIFIITAPLLTQAVKLDLPKATSQVNDLRPEKVDVAIDAAGSYWNGESISRAEAQKRMADAGPQAGAAGAAPARRPGRGLPLRRADAGRRIEGRPDARRLHQRSRASAVSSDRAPGRLAVPPAASRARIAGGSAGAGDARTHAPAPACARADRQRDAVRRRRRGAHRAPRRALSPAPDGPREAHPHQVATPTSTFAPASRRQPVPTPQKDQHRAATTGLSSRLRAAHSAIRHLPRLLRRSGAGGRFWPVPAAGRGADACRRTRRAAAAASAASAALRPASPASAAWRRNARRDRRCRRSPSSRRSRPTRTRSGRRPRPSAAATRRCATSRSR